MLNNINNRGLSKTEKVDVLNFPGRTNRGILTKIDNAGQKARINHHSCRYKWPSKMM